MRVRTPTYREIAAEMLVECGIDDTQPWLDKYATQDLCRACAAVLWRPDAGDLKMSNPVRLVFLLREPDKLPTIAEVLDGRKPAPPAKGGVA